MVKKRKHGRKIYVKKDQQLLRPSECHFRKLGFTEAEKQFFYAEYYLDKPSRKFLMRYVVTEPWRFVLRVRPNIINKVRIRDEQIEARLKGIDNYLEKNDYRKRMFRLIHGRYHWRFKDFEKPKYHFEYKNKSLRQILNLIEEY